MPRTLSSLSTLAVVVTLVGVLAAGPAHARKRGPAASEPTAAQEAVHDLRRQIAAVELHQALGLDDAQETALAALITDQLAEKASEEAERAASAPALEALLTRYLAEVTQSGAPTAATAEALRAFKEERRGDPEARKDERGARKEALSAILSKEQLEIIADFRPMAAAGPSPEEIDERREDRMERGRGRAEARGRDGEKAERSMERSERGRERHHGKQMVRRVLVSPEFLALLD